MLRHAGVVKLYCSIHESMNATILVAPARWFDVVNAKGGYALTGIPAGRYRAVVWAERLPATTREIEIGAGEQPRARLGDRRSRLGHVIRKLLTAATRSRRYPANSQFAIQRTNIPVPTTPTMRIKSERRLDRVLPLAKPPSALRES